MNLELTIAVLLIIALVIAFFFFHHHYEELLKKELHRAQKSEQLKSVFIDNVSHFLRTPLNAIKGYSNMLIEQQDAGMEPAQMKTIATNIKDNTQQLINFVGKLIELSKYEGITPSFTFIEVNLTELMASYRREVLNITKPDVTVHVATDLSPHCRAILDTNFMHQIMMHILTNAAHHITDGEILVKYTQYRKGLKVTISYMGIGQAAMIGGDIYSMLQQEDALTHINETSALGYAICKAIIDILDGEIYMNTEYDKKTVASFWFPCEMKDTHRKE